MTDEKKVMLAIKALREHMGLSQSEFAQKVFNKTLPTQQRYETVRPPVGELLATLVPLARSQGRNDLALIFKAAAIDSVHVDLRELILEPAIHPIRKHGSK